MGGPFFAHVLMYVTRAREIGSRMITGRNAPRVGAMPGSSTAIATSAPSMAGKVVAEHQAGEEAAGLLLATHNGCLILDAEVIGSRGVPPTR